MSVRALLCLLMLAGVLMPGRAQAAVIDHPDEGAAYMACLIGARAYFDQYKDQLGLTAYWCHKNTRDYLECAGKTQGACSNYRHNHRWPAGATCSTRAPMSGGWFRVGSVSATCYNGCSYSGGSGGQTIGVGGKTYQSWSGASPTGSTCNGDDEGSSKPVTQEECTETPPLTQCVTPTGKHCVVSSTGKRHCWNPQETGTKTSANEAATKSPENVVVNPPAKPPANGGQWTQTGSSTATVGSGGTTNNYTITNHQSSYGPHGNGGGAEGEGDGSGDGDGDGEQPGWTKGDQPPLPDTGGDDEVTRFGINVGPDMLDTTPIFGGGSCPSFPAITIMGKTVSVSSDIPQWCQLVAIMRAVILIMCAFAALKILMGGIG